MFKPIEALKNIYQGGAGKSAKFLVRYPIVPYERNAAPYFLVLFYCQMNGNVESQR